MTAAASGRPAATTTVAAMQPYLFPYLGYFQLIRHADLFVLGDDYPWVRAGWINRNRILDVGGPVMLTLPVVAAPVETPISERVVTDLYPRERRSILERLRHAYARSAQLEEIMPRLEEWLPADERNLFAIIRASLEGVCGYLGISTPIALSSSRPVTALRGTERVIRLVEEFGGGRFLNPPGGRGIYRRADFAAHGLELAFLDPELAPYPQARARGGFVPALSILDVLMSVPQDEARRLVLLGTESAAE